MRLVDEKSQRDILKVYMPEQFLLQLLCGDTLFYRSLLNILGIKSHYLQ